MDYLKTVSLYYETLYCRNIPVDILPYDAELEGYELILAPMLYMVRGDVAGRLQEFVKKGGTLVTTVMSGLTDENDRCIFGAYPGPLKEMLGIWVEETDALRPWEKNTMKIVREGEFEKEEYACGFLCDLIHPEGGARVIASYGEDFYKGMACVTENDYGEGKAYYIGTQPEQDFLEELLGKICAEKNLSGLYSAETGVEITLRVTDQASVVFAINHNRESAVIDFGREKLADLLNDRTLTGIVTMEAGDVIVARRM